MAGEGKRVLPAGRVAEDIDGTLTVSEFLKYVGIKLRVSGSLSRKRFLVFQKEGGDGKGEEIDSAIIGSESPPPPLRMDNQVIIGDKIRTALEHVDLANSISILAQFWARVTIGSGSCLQTLNQPFGLTHLTKGLFSYAEQSFRRFYTCTPLKSADSSGVGVDGREELVLTGPPSRAFYYGSPEYSPDLEIYSKKEYPLRDVALRGRVKSYMAVPVFPATSPQCIGVLELVSGLGSKEEMDKPAYVYGLLSTALQGVGLRASTFTYHFDMENHEEKRSNSLDNIRMALEEACMTYRLPFAQTWIYMEPKSWPAPFVLSTTSDEYYQSQQQYSIFRDTCESFHSTFGGVVSKAFGSGGSCFCQDVGRLSIADYSFSHVARKAGLTAAFAICLKTHKNSEDPGVYALELFLPNATANPQQLLERVLLTMKKHLYSFRIESGKQLDSEMNVEVLKVSEDEVESFTLFSPRSADGLVGLPVQGSVMHGEPSLLFPNSLSDFQGSMESGKQLDSEMNVEVLKVSEDDVVESFTLSPRSADGLVGLPVQGSVMHGEPSFLLPNSDFQGSMESWNSNRFFGRDTSVSATPAKEAGSCNNSTSWYPDMAEDQDAVEWTFVSSLLDISQAKKVKSSGFALRPQISREMIEKHLPLKQKDAARCLNVSLATLKRRCKELEIQWPRKKVYGNCSSASIDSGKQNNEMSETIYVDDWLQSIVSAEKDAACSKLPSSQVATLPVGSSFMTIKAQYGADTFVKFKLAFSSQLQQMKMEVASRLKLETGDFKLSYADEDGDYILLTCDADLRTMQSIMGMSTIRVRITPGDSPRG